MAELLVSPEHADSVLRILREHLPRAANRLPFQMPAADAADGRFAAHQHARSGFTWHRALRFDHRNQDGGFAVCNQPLRLGAH